MSFRPERIFFAPLAALLAGQFVVLGALWPVLRVDPDLSMRYAIFGVAVAFALTLSFAVRDSLRILGLGVGFALVSAVVPILVKGYDSFLMTIVLSTMLGYLAYRYPPPPSLLLSVQGALYVYLFIYYLYNGQLDDIFYYETNEGQSGVSRNYVGILLLQQYLLYYAVCVRSGMRPQYWPLFLMPVFAVMASGVSSTFVAILALTGFLVYGLALRKVHGVALLVAVVAVAWALMGWLESTVMYERLVQGEFVISRLLLWSDFAAQFDGRAVLVGFSNDAGFIDHKASLDQIQNLHNSYLNLYKRVGIFAVPYFLLTGYTLVALLRRHIMLGWLFLCALLRAITDGYFFTTFLVDFTLFFLFFLTPVGEYVVSLGGSRHFNSRDRHDKCTNLVVSS